MKRRFQDVDTVVHTSDHSLKNMQVRSASHGDLPPRVNHQRGLHAPIDDYSNFYDPYTIDACLPCAGELMEAQHAHANELHVTEF